MQTESPWVCGGCSSEYGFSEGSQPFGIFRPVTLVETDEVRIEPFGVHIWANEACDSERVIVNGREAKASYQVKTGDIIEIVFGNRSLKIEVTDISENVKKSEAAAMYREL